MENLSQKAIHGKMDTTPTKSTEKTPRPRSKSKPPETTEKKLKQILASVNTKVKDTMEVAYKSKKMLQAADKKLFVFEQGIPQPVNQAVVMQYVDDLIKALEEKQGELKGALVSDAEQKLLEAAQGELGGIIDASRELLIILYHKYYNQDTNAAVVAGNFIKLRGLVEYNDKRLEMGDYSAREEGVDMKAVRGLWLEHIKFLLNVAGKMAGLEGLCDQTITLLKGFKNRINDGGGLDDIQPVVLKFSISKDKFFTLKETGTGTGESIPATPWLRDVEVYWERGLERYFKH